MLFRSQVLQGYWSTVYTSTALPVDEKERQQARVEELLKAVKQAREEANTLKIQEKSFGDALFSFVTGGSVKKDAN